MTFKVSRDVKAHLVPPLTSPNPPPSPRQVVSPLVGSPGSHWWAVCGSALC